MSKTFETAGLKLVEYYVRQGDVAANKKPPQWFSELLADTYADGHKVFDPEEASKEAADLYKEAKQSGNTGVESADMIRLRQQMLFMASATQALRRRYAATSGSRQRTSVDMLRYEKERKVAAAGMCFKMIQDLKDR